MKVWWFSLVTIFWVAISLLTRVRAPDQMWAWKLALLAGEFGHWLVLAVLAWAGLVWCANTGTGRIVLLMLCGVAIAGLLRPVINAWGLAGVLPERLTTAFGPVAEPSARPAFSVVRLYAGASVRRVSPQTEVFARPGGVELQLDFYAPAISKAQPAPCLVVIHGGGWDGGDRTQLAGWNSRWAASGYAVAAISYRLAPASIWPAQRDDVLAAIAWLKAQAPRLQIDTHRFVLIGRSAGGQLATAVGYGARDPAICGVIALYAPHDMPFAWSVSREDDALNSIKLFRQYFGGPPDTTDRRAAYAEASGQLLAQAKTPPTLLIHGATDTLAWDRHSERLAARLGELGVPHYYLRLPWATHGFDFNPDGPGGQLADYAIDHFLRAVLQN